MAQRCWQKLLKNKKIKKDVCRNTLISSNQPLDRNFMAFVLLISSPNYIVVNIHQHHPAAPNSYYMYLVNLLICIPHSSEDHSTPGKLSVKGVAKRHVYYKLYEDQILQSRERRIHKTTPDLLDDFLIG
jgi:hypothetical protein